MPAIVLTLVGSRQYGGGDWGAWEEYARQAAWIVARPFDARKLTIDGSAFSGAIISLQGEENIEFRVAETVEEIASLVDARTNKE